MFNARVQVGDVIYSNVAVRMSSTGGYQLKVITTDDKCYLFNAGGSYVMVDYPGIELAEALAALIPGKEAAAAYQVTSLSKDDIVARCF